MVSFCEYKPILKMLLSGNYASLQLIFRRFNQKPKKGIQFLQDRELLGSSPSEVAEWLLTEERLDKTAKGDFLGENDESSREVIH